MPSKKRRFEFKEPSRRNSSRRRHKTSADEDGKDDRSESEDQGSSRPDSSRTQLTKSNTRRNTKDDEEVEISSRTTQTAPSHKDQASSTGNHLVTPSKQEDEPRRFHIRKSLMHPNTITPPLSSKPTGQGNEKTTQADIDDPDDASESTVAVEESHAETQTDSPEVPVKVVVAPLRPLPVGPLPPIPLPPPPPRNTVNNPQNQVEEEEDCEEECAAEAQCAGLTSADACSIMDECFPGFTECNDLDYNQLYGMAKVCVDEVKEFGSYFISQCLELIYDDDCDPCTHRVGNNAMVTECNPNGAQGQECAEENCEEEEVAVGQNKGIKTAAKNEKMKPSKAESKFGVAAEESLQSVEEDEGANNVKVDIVKVEESKSGVEIKVKPSASASVKAEESVQSVDEDASTKASGNVKVDIVKVEESKEVPEVKASASVSVKASKSEMDTEASTVDIKATESVQSVQGEKEVKGKGNVKVDILKVEKSKPDPEVKVKPSVSASVKAAKSDTSTKTGKSETSTKASVDSSASEDES